MDDNWLLSGFERVSTTEQIHRSLRDAIVSAQIPQGAQLREAHIAPMLGTSRGTVREAIRHLVQEGLAEYQMHRGAFVKILTADDGLDLYRAREAIEVKAAQDVCALTVPPSFAPLEQCLAQLYDVASGHDQPSDEMLAVDIHFHQLFVALAGSPRLSRIFDTLAAEMRMFLHNHPPYPWVDYTQDHERLLQAMKRRDESTPEAVLEHLRTAAALVVEGMAQRRQASLAG